ncbi:MAG: phosphatase PAP2 family protein, partial [Patescibacteria group bacterium]|nr:phosphatase PAP2 family protein [Patescibacteria group bacterium]
RMNIASLDLAIEQWLSAIRSPFGLYFFSFFTELGGGIVVASITALAVFLLWKKGGVEYAVGLFASVAGAIAVSELLKFIVHRARPPIDLRAILETSYSFPSNHATASAALYGFLAYLAWRLAPRKWRGIIVAICLIIIAGVGFSRMYLGVHYPTDVLGGFIVGALFVLAARYAAERILKRHSGSPSDTGPAQATPRK